MGVAALDALRGLITKILAARVNGEVQTDPDERTTAKWKAMKTTPWDRQTTP